MLKSWEVPEGQLAFLEQLRVGQEVRHFEIDAAFGSE